MSKGVNKCTFVGNLGRDPEVRYSQSGMAICSLSLAVNERKKDGDEWVDHVEWVRVTCFGTTAENVGKYCSKGRQLYVEGKVRTTKYQDKNSGEDKWSTEFIANEVLFLSGGDGDSSGQGNNSNSGQGNRGGGNRSGSGGNGNRSGNGNRGNGNGSGQQNKQNQSNNSGGGDDGFYDDDLPF